MEEHNQLQDWELLSSSSGDDSKSARGLDEEDELREVINSDYFAMNAEGVQFHHQPPAAADSSEELGSQEDGGGAGIDSDNPDSDSSSAGRIVLGAEGSFHEAIDQSGGHGDELGRLSLTVHGSDSSGDEVDEGNGTGPKGGEEKKKKKKREAAAWWKVPFEILRLYASRARPLWSIPVAAAILGFVMLGRKLYNMRHKRRRVPLRIAVDDKRASQFVTHAGRLNEALSAVKHVPIIRTSLAAGGVMQWPTATLR